MRDQGCRAHEWRAAVSRLWLGKATRMAVAQRMRWTSCEPRTMREWRPCAGPRSCCTCDTRRCCVGRGPASCRRRTGIPGSRAEVGACGLADIEELVEKKKTVECAECTGMTVLQEFPKGKQRRFCPPPAKCKTRGTPGIANDDDAPVVVVVMMMSSTLEMPLTPTAPVAVDWGALGGTETSGTSSPSRRCGRCNTRAVAALNHGAPRCLACGAEAA